MRRGGRPVSAGPYGSSRARPEAHNILGHALSPRAAAVMPSEALGEALRLRPGYPGGARQSRAGPQGPGPGGRGARPAPGRPRRPAEPGKPTATCCIRSTFRPTSRRGNRGRAQPLGRRYARGSAAGGPQAPRPMRGGPRRLRVGYVSPDLVNHAVAYFFEPVLVAHERDKLRDHMLFGRARSRRRSRRGCAPLAGRWRNIAGWNRRKGRATSSARTGSTSSSTSPAIRRATGCSSSPGSRRRSR